MATGAQVAICVAVVVGVIVLIIVAIVVAVVLALRPYVDIEQFTAEIHTDYGDNHALDNIQVVHDTYTYWTEQSVDNKAYVRVFRNDYSDYVTMCNRVGDHDSCGSLTSSSIGGYTVPFLMSRAGKDIPCPKIRNPVIFAGKKRTLTTCDKFEYISKDFTRYDYVEHDTEYPVLRNQVAYRKDGTVDVNMTEEFTYFDPEKPTNKTGLEPPSGAIVYDFRDGHTNAASAAISRVAGWFKSLFSSTKAYEIPAVKATIERFEREKAFREKTGKLLFPGFVGVGSTPDHMKTRSDASIPDSFDARENWKECYDVINTITDQDACGSCWAMSTAGVLSDRACITFGSNISYSPRYMMGCYENQAGCNGGYVGTVWDDVIAHGSVPETCFPFKPFDTACPTKCQDGTPITDSIKSPQVKGFYSPWAKDSKERVKAIQQEIMTNGPVTISMYVFDGLYKYSSGVYYRKNSEKFSGGHMVRLIGWGKEDNTDYWLVANSWTTKWGRNGYFKIRRGTNECNIENAAIAGYF